MSTMHPPASSASSRTLLVGAALAVVALLLGVLALAWLVSRDETDSAGVVQGSGVAVTQTRDVDVFGEVELSGTNEVRIGVGAEQRVVVRGDDNLVGLVTTDVHGGVLVIDDTGSFETATPMSVEITVPSLDAVRLSGSGTISIDGHELDALAVDLPGAGSIRGAGTVTTIDVDLAGTGDVDLAPLVVRDATVDVSGTGTVVVHVTGSLDANVSGTGSVIYTGEPDRVEQEITGTGSVTRE
jgi:hypothetical protein